MRVGGLALCALAACAQRGPGRAAAPRGPVVARVDGEPVTADEVALVARAEGLDARAALERVVRDRLLAREAERRGLVNADDVGDARWRARVQLLLAREVEEPNTPARIPGGFFAEMYRRRRVEFQHDGLVEVVHALALAEGARGPAARASARELAARFRARVLEAAGPRPTRERFEALAREFPGLRVEALPAFDRTGQSADGNAFVAPFVAAAWSLTDEAPLSEPFETSFGVHVALRVGSSPPLARPPEEARAVVVRDGVAMHRQRALTRLLERLRASADVRVSESALGAAAR